MKSFDFVFYHAGCVDGFTSAWIAREFLPKAEFYAVAYDQPFPLNVADLIGKKILYVDFCPTNGLLTDLVKVCNRVVILDHHKTSMERILDDCIPFVASDFESYDLALEKSFIGGHRALAAFDMHKSGACLTWQFFAPQSTMPELVRYTQDYDLWTWTTPDALPDSAEINAFIQSYPFEFEAWGELFNQLQDHLGRDMATAGGRAILQYEDKLVRSIVDQHRFEALNVPGVGLVPVCAVNSPVLASKVGNELAKISKSGIGVVYNIVSGDCVKVSVRSIKPVDITPIVTAFGGGGHKNAGGFTIGQGSSMATGVQA
jgi:oligoribonuclease NrnB/cAMP/cGMP phosphodiesterase (DHH superfamily)